MHEHPSSNVFAGRRNRDGGSGGPSSSATQSSVKGIGGVITAARVGARDPSFAALSLVHTKVSGPGRALEPSLLQTHSQGRGDFSFPTCGWACDVALVETPIFLCGIRVPGVLHPIRSYSI